MRFILIFLFIFSIGSIEANAEEKILNIYTWFGVIPTNVIQKFYQETGIKINASTYESSEVLVAKLRTLKQPYYDIIEPSADCTDRLRRQGLLTLLDKKRLPAFKNLNPLLLNKKYDPGNNYSIPLLWGVPGIFFNKNAYQSHAVARWSDLWDVKFHQQLLLLDDPRDIFSMAFRVLGYSVNDSDPQHIKQAYLKLKTLWPNIKVFNNSIASTVIDEDALVGMGWNGDLLKAKQENPNLEFNYPEEGFSVFVETLAIPKNAPHLKNAYLFLNFLLRPDVAKEIALYTQYATANLAAQKLLPSSIRNNPIIYPSKKVLSRGEFQTGISNEAALLYEKYWEMLKMGE
jgi:spermidine/putrescine transport system substrate-binding protein